MKKILALLAVLLFLIFSTEAKAVENLDFVFMLEGHMNIETLINISSQDTDEISMAELILMQEEGFETNVYVDTLGKETVGYGFSLEALPHKDVNRFRKEGITVHEAEDILHEKILVFEKMVKKSSFGESYNGLNTVGKAAVLSMVYQIGLGNAKKGTGFLGFKKFIKAIDDRNMVAMVFAVEDSRLFKQTPRRVADVEKFLAISFSMEEEGL